jgi:Transposase DDE domain group 1
MQRNSTRPRLLVTGDGKRVVAHAGSRVLCDLADELGLTDRLSAAMAPTKQRRRGHDRGQVLVDLAVMLADGGEAISDLAVLRDQPNLFGEVASLATAWRTLEAIDESALARLAVARAAARATAWAAGADPGFYVIDFDGTLITAHSEKEGAAPTYKRGFGFHPLVAYLDATGEALAAKLRPGNAGSNTAVDHVEVLDAALVQLPVDTHERQVIARTDSAALTHGFIDGCRARGVRFAVGHDLTEPIRTACLSVPKRRWQPAVSADGADERDDAQVAEITDLVDLSRWPDGTRMIVRRERPHPGAQLSLFDTVEGLRHQVFITDSPRGACSVQLLELRHRAHARVEDRIRTGKDSGFGRFPSRQLAINAAWLELALIGIDLLAWTRTLLLDGELALAEPKKLRYRLLHVAARLVHTARRTILRIARTWPWAGELATAYARLAALPRPVG